ncbi:hypothetical protein HLI_21120 (plasmid) [Halobacillus litoralis]|uniref:UvrD-like helicase C-terminal domain-containing protein n=2 Tax=Halobacillus litoralis TaxID=45668 RepID=A0A410MJ78_9BACI|nr:hypothetical protein HLI_21120 [Halobacillus litoralis]
MPIGVLKKLIKRVRLNVLMSNSAIKDQKLIQLSPMQKDGVDKAASWFKKGMSSTFTLTGYAGSGKTTCVEAMIENLDIGLRNVSFVSPTGKAALVMAQKAQGKYRATTIHKLIYDYDDIHGFSLKSSEKLKGIELIVCDEASMIDQSVLEDLLSFNIPIIFIGDNAQLLPVGKKTNLLETPDVMLTEIHRQAADNPIIHLSMLAREGKDIPFQKFGKHAVVIPKKRIYDNPAKFNEWASRADQVICGKNKTRNGMNKRIRSYKGYTSPFPQKGDKMICTRNNWLLTAGGFPMVNGLTGTVEYKINKASKNDEIKRDCMKVNLKPDFTDVTFQGLHLLHSPFVGKEEKLRGEEYSSYVDMDYGYAITCNKAQGSEFGNVVVWNEVLNYKEHEKWLYTAITRASNNLILIK